MTERERDRLIEVINIGASHASNALARLIRGKVDIDVVRAFVGGIEKTPQFLGTTDQVMTVVVLKITGDIQGLMLLLFSRESALNLAARLSPGRRKNAAFLDETDRSALREVGNILAGAALTALSKFAGLNTLQSVPDASTDMLGSMVDGIVAEMGRSSDSILAFKVDFGADDGEIDGRLFFLFDPATTTKILEATRTHVRDDRH